MGKIQIMDEWLSNRIAAGEVVERPASVVKELVENAIDAESKSISVFLEEAGITSIQVIDDGVGMDEEDAVNSFARHATSKIKKEHDLFRIRTLGFRGEALASIASVAKIHLLTSDGVESGTMLQLEAGHIIKQEPTALRRGTDITVTQLFFNTPARLKYMKTLHTELAHTVDLMNRLALCHPEIAFRLVHNGQEQLHTNGRGNAAQTLAAIYGVGNAKKMIAFEGESNDYRIHGYATLPEITRASKKYMSFFVNGRWVKSYAMQRALEQAYHTYLPIGRWPIVVLYIEGDPQLTDVNVHPAKHEIRLSKEKELIALIEQTVRMAIHNASRVPQIEKQPKPKQQPSQQLNLWKKPKPTSAMVEKMNELVQDLANQPQYIAEEQALNEALYAEPSELMQTPEEEVVQIATPEVAEEPFPQLEVVGQIHGTYIVAQMEDGFYLIDQHAAQERIKYEYFRDKVGEVNASERQTLLLPLTFHYAADEALALRDNRDALEQVGIYLESFGQNSFIVREHPSWFPVGEEQEIIEGIIEQVLTKKHIDIKKLREEAAIMMSCKRSIKANHFLTLEQMEALLRDLRQAEHPFTCPHGRPVLIHFTTYEVEKMFKRVM